MAITMFDQFKDILDINDVQKALGIGRSTAYRLIRCGDIKHLRIGKSIKIPKRFLVDFVETQCYNETVIVDLPSEGGNPI